MTINFVDTAGNRPKARRNVSAGSTIVVSDNQEDNARVMAELAKRVAQIEAAQNPDAMEFEVNLPASGTVTLEHGFGGPVRYFVTHWKEGGVAGTAPT